MDIVNPFSAGSAGRAIIAEGAFTADGTEVNVVLGFRPRVIKAVNTTAATVYEKTLGMGAANTLRTVTAGNTTVTETSDIVIDEDANNGFSIRAGVAVDEADFVWYAMA